jgi:uncharacterized cupin superfamily protein
VKLNSDYRAGARNSGHATLLAAMLLLAGGSATAGDLIVIPSNGLKDGSAFSGPAASRGLDDGVKYAQRPAGSSADKRMVAMIYESGPSKIEFPNGYPVDEFMYFITGGATLTDQSGKATKVGPGESVFVPKGWVGTFQSPAYRKYYVAYLPAATQ